MSTKEKHKIKLDYEIANVDVLVKDDNQDFLGKMPRDQAIAIAHEKNMHLILVSEKPSKNPDTPNEIEIVCRICNLGKFKFEQVKSRPKVSKSATAVKNLQLKFGVHQHDIDIRVAQAKKFLAEKHQVQLNVAIRNRDAKKEGNIDKTNVMIENFRLALEEYANVAKIQLITPLNFKGMLLLANKK